MRCSRRLKVWSAAAAIATAIGCGSAGVAQAQSTGQVSVEVVHAEGGAPMSGAQVLVVGTDIGGLTNAEGRVTLQNVPAGERVIRVQSLGFAAVTEPVTVAGGEAASLRVQMSTQAIGLDELVVTALGIERSERGLGYAVQRLRAEEIEASPQVTVTGMLAGRAAGLQVRSSSGAPGAESRIVIRGESSLTGGGQPLWVIDGVPVSMDADAHAGFAPEYGSVGSRQMDLDPNNIEDMSILRGAAATALYGSRAAHGAIIVKTRQGQRGAPATFTVSSRLSMDRAILEGKQTSYAAGIDGYYCTGTPVSLGGFCDPALGTRNPASTQTWGPHRDSIPDHIYEMARERGQEVRFADPREAVFRSAITFENSVSVRGGVGGGNYNFSVSHLDQEGTIPSSQLQRLSLNANVGINLTERMRSQTSIMFSNSQPDVHRQGWWGVNQWLSYRAPNVDLRQAWNEDGTPVMFGGNSPHPAWVTENELRYSDVNRWVASQFLAYTIVPGLHVSNRVGLDSYVDERGEQLGERPWRTQAGQVSGETRQEKITRREINNDLILGLDGVQMGRGITVSGLVGSNVNMRERALIGGLGRDINIPGSYNLGNFARQDTYGSLPMLERTVGAYAQATVDYQDWLYLTLTGRNDWSSTLPKQNNSYFYPSAALGFVFTDAFAMDRSWLDYGKLRVSFARVGSDAPPYRLRTNYGGAGGTALDPQSGISFPYIGVNAYRQSGQLGNPDLRPESTEEVELGLELRGLRNRARIEASYYDKRSFDQIFNVPSSAVTGFTQITRNAGDLRNRGIELSLDGTPIQRGGFSWDVRVNYSRNRNEVVELAEGVVSIPLAGYAWPQVRIMAGEEYGVIWGFGWQRDEQGRMLLNDEGWPIRHDEQMVIGYSQPDWLGNLTNTLRWGPLTLRGMLDTTQGGDILNFDLNYLVATGLHSVTEDRSGTRTFEGVHYQTGAPMTGTHTTDQAFWQQFVAWDTHEPQVEDGTYVRLREAVLSYQVPRSFAERIGMGSLEVSASGHNLKIWTDFSTGDPDGSNYGAANAGGAAYNFFTLPQSRSYSLQLRATF